MTRDVGSTRMGNRDANARLLELQRAWSRTGKDRGHKDGILSSPAQGNIFCTSGGQILAHLLPFS
jgi:hypothetical protein